jgi:hypothetical protein
MIAERITAHAVDSWECACGNVPEADGFWPCLPDGTEVEPIVGGPWDERLVVCRACGRILDQSTYDGTSVAVITGPDPDVVARLVAAGKDVTR